MTVQPEQLATPGQMAQPPAYQLIFEPDGTSVTARANVAGVLARELLGPAGGDDEVLEAPPDTRYLVGRIAPVRLTAVDQPAIDDVDDEEDPDAPSTLDLGDEAAAQQSRGVPVTEVDDTSADDDQDTGGVDTPVRRGVMIPASMGLRFQVPLDLQSVTVTARWGSYHPEATDEVLPSGKTKRVFRREQHEHPVTIRPAELLDGQTAEHALENDVVLRVDAATDTELNRRMIEIALCNDRETPAKIPVDAWLYQTELSVGADGAEAFMPVHDARVDTRVENDPEVRRLNLQYMDRLEFAIGRTCSADWTVASKARFATRVATTWLPTSDTPQTQAVDVDGAVLDMTVLATASLNELEFGLRSIVAAYDDWLAKRDTDAEGLPSHLQECAREAIAEARQVRDQLAFGVDFLLGSGDSAEEARRCFAFMNRVMADQRIQTQVAGVRTADPTLDLAEARQRVLDRGPEAHSWRTFQLAFILMQLPALCEPSRIERSGELARVELLFFPTGGGKTEAYLGLAAFTFAIRRRQGVVGTVDGPLDGGSGVAVLMRYTLRLLTAQQFQRATALVCAAEVARLKEPWLWGEEPFRIGLWVGTDVSPKRVTEAAQELARVHEGRGHRLTVLQIQRCPWCGTPITSRDVRIEDKHERRVRVYCGDDLGDCPFAEGGKAADGLPVLTVDEEIYRLAPAFVIATVDKFARLAREGEAASLFGYVRRRCDRHGYVHTDYSECTIKDGSKHPAKPGFPAAAVHPASRLRPPDLIIQDELHLITGALGTTVGLFEVAIDSMTTWRNADGQRVKPLIVASSATVRNAGDQVRGLYGRDVMVFPPQVLDASDTFFSTEVPVTDSMPGRRYIGVSTTGVRLTSAEIRIAEVLMTAAQLVLDTSGVVADPYLTLVGYFSATRELAGMSRYLQDDVQTALAKGRRSIGLPRRTGTNYGNLRIDELTARVSGADITRTLDEMNVAFDPDFDSNDAKRKRAAGAEAGEKLAERPVNPFDAILATAMLQVGVDVSRLGLMLMVGQPKNTAEYIQASSRVGRDANRPGLVVTLGNWARPRDLAHFEQFRHYHETFYAQVEPLSVTPFSVTSMERGLDGVLVAIARVLSAGAADGLSPERSAGKIEADHGLVEAIVDALVARVRRASDESSAETARQRLLNRLDSWGKRRTTVVAQGKSLVYERVHDDSKHAPLMRSAEDVKDRSDALTEAPFIVANSMREVQPEINILVSPDEKRLHWIEPLTAPAWSAPDTNRHGTGDDDD